MELIDWGQVLVVVVAGVVIVFSAWVFIALGRALLRKRTRSVQRNGNGAIAMQRRRRGKMFTATHLEEKVSGKQARCKGRWSP